MLWWGDLDRDVSGVVVVPPPEGLLQAGSCPVALVGDEKAPTPDGTGAGRPLGLNLAPALGGALGIREEAEAPSAAV